jgi:S-DNA-T family DNA segregation ATPase FtsK/SpoIIIE
MAARAKRQSPQWGTHMRRGAIRSGALLGAVGLTASALLLALALISYHPSDPSLNTAAGDVTRNWVSVPGAWISDIALTGCGPAVALMLALMLVVARRMWHDFPVGNWSRRAAQALLGVLLIDVALGLAKPGSFPGLPAGLGGGVGVIGSTSVQALAAIIPGAALGHGSGFWLVKMIGVGTAIGGILLWAHSLGLDARDYGWMKRKPKAVAAPAAEPSMKVSETDERAAKPRLIADAVAKAKPKIADRKIAIAPPKDKKGKQASLDLRDTYKLPSIDLLTPAPPSAAVPLDKAALERNARLLESVLDDFHVKGSITEVRPGPVVTMYELEPASGIKASRVIQLADDIARNMSALSARVATIPGRSVIGIELPNQRRESVYMHELVASQAFEDQSAQLPIILGKNISGDPVIADLAPMPHLLVAGTTGSGKSVGLNAMIASLLYKLNPDQLRMIMIDPKMLELSIYDDIPHLLAPVVTDPPKAIRALKWAVEEMENRYRMMASLGVRGLAGYNDKVRAAKAKGQSLNRRVQTGYDAETGQPVYEEEALDYQPLPQIVVIVDELADLMMTAGKEVEFLIQRLAQKARAAGIHLIMATQRPSVDVITGVIKANLPTRISFAVTSKIDSRTILGEQGAEQLLGKGDMLYMPGGKQIARVHGPFVSDEEVRAIADHWRAQGRPDYNQSVTEEPEDGGWSIDGAPDGEDSAEDALFRKAVQVVAESQKASVSYVQRQLRVGYNSAARLIERMEQQGLVGRPDHVGRREVLIDTEGHAI